MEPPRSIAELRRVSQPDEVRGRRNAEHWTASLYLRRLSPYLTWTLLRTPISANGVTGLMILVGWSTAAALLIPGIWGAVLALILGQLQMLVDCCDGEVARWRRTSSPAGVFLDKVGHYTTEAAIAIMLGFRAAGSFDINSNWVFVGLLLAVVLLINKSLNDFVHVARAYAGLPKVEDSATVTAPKPGLVARARRIARIVPFYKMFHSIEMTLLAFVASAIDVFTGDLIATRILVAVMLPLAVLATIGHFVAILSSRRLKAA